MELLQPVDYNQRSKMGTTDFGFVLERACQDSWARAGSLSTPHGEILTPVFAPVGTQATVKTMSPRELTEVGASLLVANTYHLYLRPGPETVAELGGLHRFMGWDGPILTDSGGFQVFSMEHLRSVDDDGVTFRSHIDGAEHRLTPEKSIAIQEQLGADLVIALDVCPPYPSDYEYNRLALDRTHHWAKRCLAAQTRSDQMMLGVIQGGTYADLREESTRFFASLPFPGYAIGGLSVGEPKKLMHQMLDLVIPLLPDGKPRHLLGVGSPEDLFEGVWRGIDIFDCALPTRVARNGTFFTPQGRLNIRNARYADDATPIQDDCSCYTCRNFSRAYLRHLVIAKEILGLHLATLHNLHFMIDLMDLIRDAIIEDRFAGLRQSFLDRYRTADYDAARRDRRSWLKRLQTAQGVSND